MKNTIKHFQLSAVILSLGLSFAQTQVVAAVPSPISAYIKPVLDGGAYLVFAGKFGGNISKKEMLGQTKVTVDGCPGAKDYTIVQFTLTVTKGSKTSSFNASSNALTKEMLASLSSLSNGDSFEFKGIKAKLATSKDVVTLHSKAFTVTAQGV